MHSNDEEASPPAAVLCSPAASNHAVHERKVIETLDHEDHTFCGIMFDVECRDVLPLAFLEISSLCVRGDLGPMTIWALPGGLGDRIREPSRREGWQLIYEREHSPSPTKLVPLVLGDRSVKLASNSKLGLYIHSKFPGDSAIVYDNQRGECTYEDMYLRIHPGLAHLSNKPFGRHCDGWWWGSPWRLRREFVGRIDFGICYQLWNPQVHQRFNKNFRQAVKCLLLISSRPESRLYFLSDTVIYYMLNMCSYDWFDIDDPDDDSDEEDAFLLRESLDDDAWFRKYDPASRSLWPPRHVRGFAMQRQFEHFPVFSENMGEESSSEYAEYSRRGFI